MKKVQLFISSILVSSLFLTGCTQAPPPTADQIDQAKQEIIQKSAVQSAGMPAIDKFTELKMINLIYEMRDNPKLINYAYLQSEYSGKLIYIGRCVGYPIPYATQRSNPQKVQEIFVKGLKAGNSNSDINGSYGTYTLPQAEPNGLFMPASADATWILMLNPEKNNLPEPQYFEPKLTVLTYKLEM